MKDSERLRKVVPGMVMEGMAIYLGKVRFGLRYLQFEVNEVVFKYCQNVKLFSQGPL